MINGIYLVNRRKTDVEAEMELFSRTPGLNMKAVCFEDVVTTVGGEDNDSVILSNGDRIPRPDVVFPRVFGLDAEENYRLKSVLRMFENMGALCINPPGCKDITADKILTFQVVSRVVPAGMIPRTMLVTGDVDPKVVGDYVGYPVVLKVLHGEGGKGVILVRDEAELRNILKLLSASPMTDQVIAQQAIMSSKGRDLRIVVINGKAVDAIVRCNPGSFTSNVHQGGHVEFCDPPEQLKEIAVRVADAIGILFGSVDFLFGEKEGEFYLCEANSSVGLPYLMDGSRDARPYVEGLMGLLKEVERRKSGGSA